MSTDTLQTLADRTNALSPGDRLRLAAALIDAGQYDLARPIVERVDGELALLKLTEGR